MNYVLSLLLIIIMSGASAEEILPSGCKPLVVQKESLTLPENEPSLVMIHNLSNNDLWLTHPTSEAGVNLNTQLQAGNWSALALDKEVFELGCIESRPGHEQQVPCFDVLAVCQWLTAKRPENIVGTVWAGEDMVLSALTAYVGRHGFVLPTATQ